MKKRLLFLVALLCALPQMLWAQTTTSQPAVGDGSATNPYQITSPDELRWFALRTGTDATACGKLMNDITLSSMTIDATTGAVTNKPTAPNMSYLGGGATTTANSYTTKTYTGTFDGQGYALSGMYLNYKAQYYDSQCSFVLELGKTGVIKNLRIANSCSEAHTVALMCYSNAGTISGCDVSALLVQTGSTGGAAASFCISNGSTGTIDKCSSTAFMQININSSTVSGFCNSNSNVISNCLSKIYTNATSASYSQSNYSGFCNSFSKGTMTNCVAISTLSGSGFSPVYAFSARNTSGSIQNCYAMSTPSASGVGSGSSSGLATVSSLSAVSLHYFDAQGICTLHGNDYQAATQASDGYYEIKNAGNLKWFAQTVNAGSVSINGRLMNDIDLASVCSATAGNWTPIGTDSYMFKGIFDGQYHKISNLYINATTALQGLFGHSSGGTIQKLSVSGNVTTTVNEVALLVGNNQGTISDCNTSGQVSGAAYVGGITGENSSTITRSYNTAKVTASSGYGGGVAGINQGKGAISHSYNSGAISSASDGQYKERVGGVVGWQNSDDASVKSCYNIADISRGGTISAVIIGGKTAGLAENDYFLSTSTSTQGWGTATLAADFASGRIACLLNGGSGTTQSATGVWGQTIGTDAYPTLGGSPVYGVYIDNILSAYGNANATVTLPTPPRFLGEKICNGIYTDGTNTYTTSYALAAADVYLLNGAADNMASHKATDGYYEITTAQQLAWLAYYVNAGNTYTNARLMNSISLATECGEGKGNWTPIGTERPYFYKGTFDGRGNTISDLYINATIDYQGLFGRVGSDNAANPGGTVQNLHVKGIVNGNNHVSLVVGMNVAGGRISNCTSEGSVQGYQYIGGIAGSNGGILEHVSNSASVTGNNQAGGIAGYSRGAISYANNSGNISVTVAEAGGICGQNKEGKVDNCYNTGNVVSTNGNFQLVGGICGDIYSGGYITNCYNTGVVTIAGSIKANKAIIGDIQYISTIVTATNNYYLNEDATVTTPYGTRKTAAEFKSGLIARLLNGGDGTTEKAGDVWGQTVGSDAMPLLGAPAVYSFTTDGTLTGYYNEGNKVTLPDVPSFDGFTVKETYYTENNIAVTNPYVVGKADANIISSPTTTDMSKSQALDGYYEITTPTQLAWLADYVNKGNTNTNARLMNDIDLASVCSATLGNWTPIGTDSYMFKGIFDGQYHKISNLYINATTALQGLFGHSSEGTIQKLSVSGNVTTTVNEVALLVGNNQGTISDCNTSGQVSGAAYVGGIAGENDQTITRSYNTAKVTASSGNGGGVAGINQGKGTISHSYNSGAISSASDGLYKERVGGIVGSQNSDDASVKSCYNVAVVSKGGTVTATIIGSKSAGLAENNYFLRTSTSSGDYGIAILAADFASGRITRLLNGSGTTQSATGVWGQTIGTDAYPTLGGSPVYAVYINNVASVFSNANATVTLPTPSRFLGEKISNGIYTDGTNTYTTSYALAAADVYLSNGAADNMASHKATDGYYEITTAQQLAWLAYYVNAGNTYTSARLMNSISLATECGEGKGSWTPIGTDYTYSYKGTFDGRGNTISDLYINAKTDRQSLFGRVGSDNAANPGGTVRNLRVKGIVNGNNHVSLVVGMNVAGGRISNCTSEGSVQGYQGIGGITGSNGGILEHVSNSASVMGFDGAGGIAGYFDNGTISYASNSGNISISLAKAGGICGQNQEGKIDNCYNTGNVASTNDHFLSIGGICGQMDYSSNYLTNCYNAGVVTIAGSIKADRAIIGALSSTATVTATNNYYLNEDATVTTPYGTRKTAAEFKSGLIARLLNGGDGTTENAGDVWGQTLGVDDYPLMMKADKSNAVYNATVYRTDGPTSIGFTNLSYATPTDNHMTVLSDAGIETSILPANVITAENTANSIVITDGQDFYIPDNITAASATYTRSCFRDGYHETICLPFAPDATPEGYALSEYRTKDENNAYFQPATSWTPGKAYLLKYTGTPSSEKADVTFSATGSVNVVHQPVVEDYFNGLFEANFAPSQRYILGVYGTQEIFKEASATYSLKPFRCYLNLKAPGSKALQLVFGDETPTGINGTQQELSGKDRYYDLQGRPVKDPMKGGLYIINGSKRVYK